MAVYSVANVVAACSSPFFGRMADVRLTKQSLLLLVCSQYFLTDCLYRSTDAGAPSRWVAYVRLITSNLPLRVCLEPQVFVFV